MNKIVHAGEKDKTEILKLYKMQLGREYCPWTEDYPNEEKIDYDLGRDSLLVMRNEGGRIIAAITLDEDEKVESLDCWTESLLPGGELSRLAVDPEYQNMGLAREMILEGCSEWKKRGRKSAHYLVDKHNVKALRSYAHLGFTQVGETQLFGGEPFWCCEKAL